MKAMRCLLLALALPGTALGQHLKPVYRTLVPADTSIRNNPVSFSPNDRLIAYRRGEDLYIYDRSTRKSMPTRLGNMADYSWSAKGDRITFLRRPEDSSYQRNDHQVWVVDVNPGTGIPTRAARRVTTGVARSPRFSPDGAMIAFIRADSARQSIIVVPANGGRERVLYQGVPAPGVVEWSRDGKSLSFQSRATNRATGRVVPHLIRVSVTGNAQPEVSALPIPGAFAGFSADGRFAAHLVPWDRPTGIVLRTLAGKHLGTVDLPPGLHPKRWSSSGLKFTALQSVWPTAVFAIDVATGNPRSFSGDWGQDENPQYSPDGRSVVFQTVINAKRRLVLADANGGNRRVLNNPSEPVGNAKWSPDGRYLAFLTEQLYPRVNTLTVLDVRTGEEKQLGRSAPAARIVWRKDGKALVRTDRLSPASPDSMAYVDVDLQGKETRLLTFRGTAEERGHAGVRGALLDDEWVAFYSPEQIELRNLRDRASHIVHRGFRGSNLNYNNDRGISPDGKTLALNVPEETASGRKWVTRLVTIRTGEARLLKTGMEEGDVDNVFWLPDGRNVIVPGYTYPSDVEHALVHVVPLNGEPWRDIFARVNAQDFGRMTISPDGRTILITAIKNFGSQLVELDLTEALKNVKLP